jgi:SpoVK/Ycf46/Vps4 family AAA+-type ATPase
MEISPFHIVSQCESATATMRKALFVGAGNSQIAEVQQVPTCPNDYFVSIKVTWSQQRNSDATSVCCAIAKRIVANKPPLGCNPTIDLAESGALFLWYAVLMPALVIWQTREHLQQPDTPRTLYGLTIKLPQSTINDHSAIDLRQHLLAAMDKFASARALAQASVDNADRDLRAQECGVSALLSFWTSNDNLITAAEQLQFLDARWKAALVNLAHPVGMQILSDKKELVQLKKSAADAAAAEKAKAAEEKKAQDDNLLEEAKNGTNNAMYNWMSTMNTRVNALSAHNAESGGDDAEFLQMVERARKLIRKPTVEEVRKKPLIGLDEAKLALAETFLYPTMFPQLYSMHVEPWSGLLLVGSPGTGKTTIVATQCAESKTVFIPVSPADVRDKWRGNASKMIKALFQVARKEAEDIGCKVILFFDEVEQLASKRGDSGSSDSSAATSSDGELQQMLTEMTDPNNEDVFVVAATNWPDKLDEAFLRRLPRKVYCGLPTKDDAIALLNLYLNDRAHLLTANEIAVLAEQCVAPVGDIVGLSAPKINVVVRLAMHAIVEKAKASHMAAFGGDSQHFVPCSCGNKTAETCWLRWLPVRKESLMEMGVDANRVCFAPLTVTHMQEARARVTGSVDKKTIEMLISTCKN